MLVILALTSLIEAEILRAVGFNEPRARITSIVLEDGPDGETVNTTITFEAVGEEEILTLSIPKIL